MCSRTIAAGLFSCSTDYCLTWCVLECHSLSRAQFQLQLDGRFERISGPLGWITAVGGRYSPNTWPLLSPWAYAVRSPTPVTIVVHSRVAIRALTLVDDIVGS